MRGKRHPLWVMLVTIVMGNLAGYWGNRPLAAFASHYGEQIAELLQVEQSKSKIMLQTLSATTQDCRATDRAS